MNYLISYPENNLIVAAVAEELYKNINTNAREKTITIVCTHAQAQKESEYLPTSEIEIVNTIIAFDPDAELYRVLLETIDTKIVVILSADGIVENSKTVTSILRTLKHRIISVLAPVPTWFEDDTTPEAGKEMEHALRQAKCRFAVVNDIHFIKYLGTIPKVLIPDKTLICNGLIAVIQYMHTISDYTSAAEVLQERVKQAEQAIAKAKEIK